MGSAGFSAAYWTAGPMGMIEPERTMSGILSMGASAAMVWPPGIVSPVQKSIHRVSAGR